MSKTYVIAEIGINHNGSIDLCKQLIDAAVDCGADAIKLQKRSVDVVYTAEELAKPREHPWGTTNGELKRHLEFGRPEYDAIDTYCRQKGIDWFASCWDAASLKFIDTYRPPYLKIASASLTDTSLLLWHRATGVPLILSTGMSTLEEIDHAVDVLAGSDLTLLHCHAAYPSPLEELNLQCIRTLKERYGLPIGFSSHAVSPWPALMAVCVGATMVEAHLTLDRTSWGSDQAASLEPGAFKKLVQEIRTYEKVIGDGCKKVYDSELPAREKLRRVK